MPSPDRSLPTQVGEVQITERAPTRKAFSRLIDALFTDSTPKAVIDPDKIIETIETLAVETEHPQAVALLDYLRREIIEQNQQISHAVNDASLVKRLAESGKHVLIDVNRSSRGMVAIVSAGVLATLGVGGVYVKVMEGKREKPEPKKFPPKKPE